MKYIGITIGPIVDTLMEASSPASMWFASSMFSDITKRLCVEILNAKAFDSVRILSPFFDDENEDEHNSGIGKYHDRIIFCANSFDDLILQNVINGVKKDVAKVFPLETASESEFFEQYLQINFVVLDDAQVNGNCILTLGRYLDAIELMKTFPAGYNDNPILNLLSATKGGNSKANKLIKESYLFPEISGNSQLIKNGNIRQIEDIAGANEFGGNELKYSRYFAIISADGDSMTECLKRISNDKIPLFSKCCLIYNEEAAHMIGDFGGMTIYAGGDDLLFITPVIGTNGSSVFELCARINNRFREIIRNSEIGGAENFIPTISFGISIQYYKYPLYEAFANSRILLGIAKQQGKNAQAINLQKHSGQSISLLVKNDKIGKSDIERDDQQGLLRFINTRTDENSIKSVLFALRSYEGYIKVLYKNALNAPDKAIAKNNYLYGWVHLFDNDEQKKYEKYIKETGCAIFDEILFGEGIEPVSDSFDEREKEEKCVETAFSVLQLAKFLTEKVMEQEKEKIVSKEGNNNE